MLILLIQENYVIQFIVQKDRKKYKKIIKCFCFLERKEMIKMNKKKNSKGFTLVELLAVIVVLAIVMGLAVVGIGSVLDNTRKSAFAADAKSYLEGARSLVNSEQANLLLNPAATTQATPNCRVGATTTSTTYVAGANANASYLKKEVKLSAIVLESGGKSPYGANYDKNNSKVEVRLYGVTVGSDNKITVCPTTSTYKYYIYITDGTHSIGTSSNLIEDSVVSGANVS